jgi:D-glycero-D-manno-heptose 1,7-bisphosphate phosphatase
VTKIFAVASRHSEEPIVAISEHMKPSARDLVVFDRDDTLIFDRLERVRAVADVQAIPGALVTLKELSRIGCAVGIISNQSAVARGLVPLERLIDIMEHLAKEVFSDRDGSPLFQFWIACPHLPEDNCACRKPKPAMILAAMAMHPSLERAVFVGDQETDVQAAEAAGIAALRISGPLQLKVIEAALSPSMS